MADYLYIPDDDSEYGPVWEATEARDNFTRDELATAQPAELIVDLGGHRGHYLAADWLSEAADILESVQLGVLVLGPRAGDSHPWPGPDLSEDHKLRDRVDELKHEANEAWGRYHAHNDLVGADPDQVSDYGDDCDGAKGDCPCFYISDLADDVESVLGDLGYVTEWRDGVRTYWVHADVSQTETGDQPDPA